MFMPAKQMGQTQYLIPLHLLVVVLLVIKSLLLLEMLVAQVVVPSIAPLEAVLELLIRVMPEDRAIEPAMLGPEAEEVALGESAQMVLPLLRLVVVMAESELIRISQALL